MIRFLKGKGYKTKLLYKLRLISPGEIQRREDEEALSHPERLALLPYIKGKYGIDVGCGFRKTSDKVIGIDIIKPGSKGAYGVVKNKNLIYDICASGDTLPLKDNSLDYVVSRHNVEHYVDVVKLFREWIRVLKPGGVIASIVPDDQYINSIALDKSHKHAFTRESLTNFFNFFAELKDIRTSIVIKNWSFLITARLKKIKK